MSPLHYVDIPLAQWTESFVNWMLLAWGGFFDAVSHLLSYPIDGLETLLLWIPAEVVVLLFALLSWRVSGVGLAVFAALGLFFIGTLDLWEESMQTLSIVLASTAMAMIIGIPLGILMARFNSLDRVFRPILDLMQTMPSFVYLIPMLLLFSIGRVPAVLATVIFAMPPAVRLTNLGIRQVSEEVIEAAKSFGSTPQQMLFKVQLPMATPTILAGINQTIMLALSMAVISAMIGAPGLGSVVLSGIMRVQVGIGLEGGLGIVILAVLLDRMTEAMGHGNKLETNR